MTTESLFLYATRNKLRWPTARGELSVEHLWDAPLRPKPGDGGFNLDAIAKATNRALKDLSEESFVETKRTPAHTQAAARFEIVKFIIETKLEDEKRAEKRAANQAEAARVLEILAQKKDEKLAGKSEAELKRLLTALTSEDDQ